MSLGPAPSYMTAGGGMDRQTRIRQVADAVDAATRRAAREAVAAFGDIVPDHLQAEGDGRVTVDLDGVGRVDVGVGPATVTPTIPPGWHQEPSVGRGDVLASATESVVVIAVLGNRDDPRPGYTVASIGRDGQGRPDVSQIGPTYTVAPDGLANARRVDRVELP